MALAPELVGLLAAFCFLLAMLIVQFGYTYTFGALLKALASLLNVGIGVGIGPTVHPFAFLGGALNSLDNQIRHAIGVGVQYGQYGWNRMLQFTAYSIQETGRAIEGLAHDTLQFAGYVRHHLIRAAIAVAIGPIWLAVYALEKLVRALATTVPKLAHQAAQTASETTTAVRTKVIRIERTVVHTTTTVIASGATIALPRIRRAEHELTGLEKWVREHAKQLTEAGIAGLVVAALGRHGLGWTRCAKVGKLGKGVCGLDNSLIESLLTDSLAIFGTLSLIEFADEMKDAIKEASPLITHFWRADVKGTGGNRLLGHAA